MSKPYTDEEVQAGIAAEFALWESKGGHMPGAEESIPAILDAVAPAIAARTLREAAEAYGPGQITFMGSATGYTKAWLDERAFEIEAKA